jgi:hypothetical protein
VVGLALRLFVFATSVRDLAIFVHLDRSVYEQLEPKAAKKSEANLHQCLTAPIPVTMRTPALCGHGQPDRPSEIGLEHRRNLHRERSEQSRDSTTEGTRVLYFG